MKNTPRKIVAAAGCIALAAIIAWLAQSSQPPPPQPETPVPVPAPVVAEAPAAVSAPRADEAPRSTAALKTRLVALFGRPLDEVLGILAELRLPPIPKAILEKLLVKSPNAEAFAKALMDYWFEFQTDRFIAWMLTHEFDKRQVKSVFMDYIPKLWKERALESYRPSAALVRLMMEHFPADEDLNADEMTRYLRSTDPQRFIDGFQNETDPKKRADALALLGYQWPPSRLDELLPWARANLGPVELDAFLREKRTGMNVAYYDPNLALRLLEEFKGTPYENDWKSAVIPGLMRHRRVDEALALLASIPADAGPASIGLTTDTPPSQREWAIKIGAKHWALRDPDAAIAWVNELSGPEFNTALGAMFEHLPAATMRIALDGLAKQQPDASQDVAVLRGLSRTTSWTDTATAAEVIPGYYAARGFAPLAAPSGEQWKGTPIEQSRALQFDVAARTVWSLSQKQSAEAALAWADRVQWATPQDKLIAQAYALPETVEIYQKNSVLGPIRGWINQQLAEPVSRAALEQRLAQIRAHAPRR